MELKTKIVFEDSGRSMQIILRNINPERISEDQHGFYMQAAVYSALNAFLPNDDICDIHWNAYDATTGEFITSSEL